MNDFDELWQTVIKELVGKDIYTASDCQTNTIVEVTDTYIKRLNSQENISIAIPKTILEDIYCRLQKEGEISSAQINKDYEGLPSSIAIGILRKLPYITVLTHPDRLVYNKETDKIPTFEAPINENDSDLDTVVGNITEGHSLHNFTNDELFDILSKPNEWGKINYNAAKTILTERGQEIDHSLLESQKQQRLTALSLPEKAKRSLIIAGYLFALLGGPVGMIIGYSLFASKKTLPNKEKIYSYTQKDRTHGNAIFGIGLIVFSVFFIYRILD